MMVMMIVDLDRGEALAMLVLVTMMLMMTSIQRYRNIGQQSGSTNLHLELVNVTKHLVQEIEKRAIRSGGYCN